MREVVPAEALAAAWGLRRDGCECDNGASGDFFKTNRQNA